MEFRRLGVVRYDDAIARMTELVHARAGGLIPDTVLLLEHPAVITLGRSAKLAHVLASREDLSARGVGLFDADRGGDATVHAPGQIVAYPIFDLKPDRCDVRRYVAGLEEVMIRTVARHGIRAARRTGFTGVWIRKDEETRAAPKDLKIGAIGVRISRWITSHGLALNVSIPLELFGLIVPCGIRDASVTSIAVETSSIPSVAVVMTEVEEEFRSVFGR